jgi:hypothetical protein
MEIRLDVSMTEFAGFIRQDPEYFVASDPDRIAAALEDFHPDRTRLHAKIDELLASDATDLVLCTNVGASRRPSLPANVRDFARHFFDFSPAIHEANLTAFGEGPYSVLSVRCGDEYFGTENKTPPDTIRQLLFRTIEKRILKLSTCTVVVMSDSSALKKELGARYGMRYLDNLPQHGGFGNVEPVVRDLDLLKHSCFNYHINAWQTWWSGFSHYTSLIFEIPYLNIAPLQSPAPPPQAS